MPELTELQAHAERLAAQYAGAVLDRFEPLTFTALKTFRPAPEAASGRPLQGVARRGKYLLLDFGAATFVVHLMQGGRLKPDAGTSKKPRFGVARWRFGEVPSGEQPALLLTEAGTERKAGVWVVEGDPLAQPPLDDLGPEADHITPEELAARFIAHSKRLHTWLRDQELVAGIGRRLANEVCHRARLSPFAPTKALGLDGAEAVAAAIRACVSEELDEERARPQMSSSKDRAAAMHGRTGQACPACGDVVRAVEYRDYTVNYCATCQTGGKVLADNTTSKFLR